MDHRRTSAIAAMALAVTITLAPALAACTSNAPPSTSGAGDASSVSAAGTSTAPTSSASSSTTVPTTGSAASVPSTGGGVPATGPSPTAAPTATFTCLRTPSSWDDNVRLGDCDTRGYVFTIEERLNVLGFPCTADNQFRADTDTAVRNFQISRGLTVDGQVGPNTWAALVEGGIGD